MSDQKKSSLLQWLAISLTVIFTVVGWINVASADRRESQLYQQQHERRIGLLEDFRSSTEITLSALETNVAWIRKTLEDEKRRSP